jgi:hypothetical protein
MFYAPAKKYLRKKFDLLFVLFSCFCFACGFSHQSSEELDTDTEFEPVEDMTIETRSRCKIFFCFVACFVLFNVVDI